MSIRNPEPGELIPYSTHDAAGEQIWGYMDGETFEIVIGAKYAGVSPFADRYAAVQRTPNGGWYIIDKNEKVIVPGDAVPTGDAFAEIDILVSEDGKNHLAILGKKYERTHFDSGLRILGDSVKAHFYKEDHYKYRLVNLVDGKTIIPEKESDSPVSVQLVGGYFVVKEDLYQFLDNGSVQRVTKNNAALAVSILEQYLEGRGINARVGSADGRITIEYEPFIAQYYANPDLSGAFEDLKEADPPFTIPFARSSPLFRDHRMLLNAPLTITERKYVLVFRDEKTRQQAMGIYNETKAEWEVFPYFTILKNEEPEEWERYYVIDIMQTNNPGLYRLHLKTDSMDWNDRRYILVAGGIFDSDAGEFIDHLFLEGSFDYYGSPWMQGDARNIKFPGNGVYLFFDEEGKH